MHKKAGVFTENVELYKYMVTKDKTNRRFCMSRALKKMGCIFLITFFLMYACFVMIKQEFMFIEYKQEIEKYARLIEEEELRSEYLNDTRASITSDEYIEEVARKKLGLVLPSEIIFVNANL